MGSKGFRQKMFLTHPLPVFKVPMMKVPLFCPDYTNQPHLEAFNKVFQSIIQSGKYILGEAVEQFEHQFAAQNHCKYAVGVSSGTDALLIALQALDIQPNDEVLCPSFTFFASASTIARLGAQPVWVDVHTNNYLIDLADAEKKVSSRTKAIVVVHLFGQSCEPDAVKAFAQRHHLKIIEDVAQAQGAKSQNLLTGSWGDVAAFSFFPTKNLGGFGDAGMVTTQDTALFEKIKCLRVHGSHVTYEHLYLGGNFRIDTLQAALLAIKLPYVDEAISKRRANAERYLSALQGIDSLCLPNNPSDGYHTWNQFTVRVLNRKRDELKAFLAQQAIGSAIYYPKTLDQQPSLRSISTDQGIPTARAHQLTQEVLSLPIYPGLTTEQIDWVCRAIQNFFSAR